MILGKILEKLRRQSRQQKYDTPFPLPQDVQDFTKTLKTDQVNFQTNLRLGDIAEFYRRAFTVQGFVEIELATVIADDSISLAFAGLPGDKKVIVQAVDRGYSSNIDKRNVNLRTEGSGPRRGMPDGAYWAYDFDSDRSLEAMPSVFNEAGPWQWELRESAWYGDYLNTYPTKDVRIRIHEYPQYTEMGEFNGLRASGFSALLGIEAENSATQAEVDKVFRGLLGRVNATNITEIEWYD